MSENQLKELEDKIHEMYMEKLLNIHHVAKEMNASKAELDKLTKELEEIQIKLNLCDPDEVNKYRTMVTLVNAKIKIIGEWKSMLQQYRLLIRNLEKEIQILYARKIEAEQ